MLRVTFGAVAALLMVKAAAAGPFVRTTAYDGLIAEHATLRGVPASFIHRTVLRESHYNPGLVHNRCFGLMQIKYATARGLGYAGSPSGLLDPQVNLTYGVSYLANAYRLAGGNEERATALYRRGYYYYAKRRKMLGLIKMAAAPPMGESQPQQSSQEHNTSTGLFSFLTPAAKLAE